MEQKIVVRWNLLVSIPGERLDDYEAQLSLMRKIPHLTPPGRVSPIRIDRYSPYFARYREFGWTEIQPLSEYRDFHPGMSESALRDVAYHFRGLGGVTPDAYLEQLEHALGEWRRRNKHGDGLFNFQPYTVVGDRHGQFQEAREVFGYRSQPHILDHFPFGPPEVRAEDYPAPFID